jgi:hypothetical protein
VKIKPGQGGARSVNGPWDWRHTRVECGKFTLAGRSAPKIQQRGSTSQDSPETSVINRQDRKESQSTPTELLHSAVTAWRHEVRATVIIDARLPRPIIAWLYGRSRNAKNMPEIETYVCHGLLGLPKILKTGNPPPGGACRCPNFVDLHMSFLAFESNFRHGGGSGWDKKIGV